ncbi:MAG: flagellar hook assembly protein FlgD [Steroidobacteraceae bacterium]
MSVSTISAYAAQTAAAAAATAASGGTNGTGAGSANSQLALTQSDFLQLLVTQMQNQDPTQPTNPSQFVNEFSALSEVSGINSMSNSMSALSSSMSSAQILSGTNLIGHTVVASGNSAALTPGGSITGAVNVPSGTNALTVQVTDANGQLVRTFSVPAQTGVTPFTWDGTTNSGSAAPSGTYNFTVTADTNGTATSLTPELAYKVNSVTLNPTNNSLTLNTDGGSLPLSSVSQVM